MTQTRRLIPIYTTPGDVGAYLVYPNLFNNRGEWIGWVTSDRDVYSVLGNYIGWLSDDPRILRKRSYDFMMPRKTPPQAPARIRVPANSPLAPMMAELTYTTIDVLEEEPERLSTIDADDLREDMD
jgi:hypothetical protein